MEKHYCEFYFCLLIWLLGTPNSIVSIQSKRRRENTREIKKKKKRGVLELHKYLSFSAEKMTLKSQ